MRDQHVTAAWHPCRNQSRLQARIVAVLKREGVSAQLYSAGDDGPTVVVGHAGIRADVSSVCMCAAAVAAHANGACLRCRCGGGCAYGTCAVGGFSYFPEGSAAALAHRAVAASVVAFPNGDTGIPATR
jgi:hypothetical protein